MAESQDTIQLDASLSKFASSTQKRKASPMYNATPIIKRRNITRLSKTKPVPKSTQKSVPFTDILLESFKEKQFLEGFAPIFQGLISPLIQYTVEETMKLGGSTLSELTESNKQLHELVRIQMSKLEEQQKMIEKQTSEQKLKGERIDELEEKSKLEIEADDLQQYGRRNSIRLSKTKFDPSRKEEELTDKVAEFLNKFIPEASISADDIERCHPVGRYNGSKQILVKI